MLSGSGPARSCSATSGATRVASVLFASSPAGGVFPERGKADMRETLFDHEPRAERAKLTSGVSSSAWDIPRECPAGCAGDYFPFSQCGVPTSFESQRKAVIASPENIPTLVQFS